MTNAGMFEEIELREELKRYKREIKKLQKIIDQLETEIEIKDYEIKSLKENKQ
jgi:predicted RNase H-like nuclease (RuvC/YqgF family)